MKYCNAIKFHTHKIKTYVCDVYMKCTNIILIQNGKG